MPNEPEMLMVYFNPEDREVYRNLQGCLEQLTKKPPTQLAPLMAKGRIIVKRQAHPQKDLKLVNLLNATGAQCRFVKQAADGAEPEQTPRVTKSEIDCPRCGHHQVMSEECIRCGIIFSRFKPRQDPEPKSTEDFPVAGKTVAVQEPDQTVDRDDRKPSLLDKMALRYAWVRKVRHFRRWLKGYPQKNTGFQQWSKKFQEALSRFIVMWMITLLLDVLLIYGVNYLWFMYTWTQIGVQYAKMHPELAAVLNELFSGNNLSLGLSATLLAAAGACFFSVIGRFFMVSRFLSDPFGIIGRTILWVLPITAATAWWAAWQGYWDLFITSFWILIFPMFCLSARCLELARMVVPESTLVVRTVSEYGKEGFFNLVKGKQMIAELLERIKSQ